MPLQCAATPPPAQPEHRVTDQNADRAKWSEWGHSRICVQIAGVVFSCWSLRPFMPEMPMCEYAVAFDQPYAFFSASRSPLAALTVLPYMSEPPPKSNGMIVKTS